MMICVGMCEQVGTYFYGSPCIYINQYVYTTAPDVIKNRSPISSVALTDYYVIRRRPLIIAQTHYVCDGVCNEKIDERMMT